MQKEKRQLKENLKSTQVLTPICMRQVFAQAESSLEEKRKVAKKGLRQWVKDKWVDIGAPKKNGKFQPCGRSKGSGRKYPKCVPLSKARSMSESEKKSAVRRKRAKPQGVGGIPTNVSTFKKRRRKKKV